MRLKAYATPMRTNEYNAYSGSALGFCEMCAPGATGPSHERPMAYKPKTAANKNNISAISIRKAHGLRDPNGRAAARVKGPDCWETGVVEVTEGQTSVSVSLPVAAS